MQGSLKHQARPRELLLPQAPNRPDTAAKASIVGQVRRARRPGGAPWEEGHSLAWLAWCAGALLALWMASNPLYLMLILLSAVVVFLNCARQDALARSFRLFLLIGAIIFALQIVFSVVTAGDLRGQTVLIKLPELHLPALLGGITLGGFVTAEQLAWGAVRGLRLWTALLVIGAFNASVNHYRLLRRVPAFLFHAALVATIALALVPHTIVRLQSIREAQQLRGHRFRRWRDALPLLAPLIAGSLERSLTLAEAMESRGYGRTVSAAGTPGERMLAGRLLASIAGLFLVLGTFGLFYSSALRPPGIALMCLGALLLVLELRRLGRLVVRTRYSRERWRHSDIALALSALAVPPLLAALHLTGVPLDSPIFPRLQPPPFNLAAGLCLLLLVSPALLRPARRATPPTVAGVEQE